ncbi:probable UDP-3-O-acyl-N-acetylglucosamine deacetylase 1, mitochondrial isoform X3 [Salvia splendens]|uniref:probable UDP-3-O-acyl-N-acetylglucosamine deacetylase 1, mitochondrial isoform X3 n=1 Tax=Salvia splendens TaxID=180675 RepID=UPI001C26D144|nr:probable UDP-3-O-acyl-N-acetylglucosamine deacetylase 1, mitochondrial isoform X3 [Salvia splendens]
MSVAAAFKSLKSSALFSWKPTGKLQKTVANCIERTGQGLHSGEISTVKILSEAARAGRYFIFGSNVIRASIDNIVRDTPLCTALSRDGYSVRTVEHLLSALEACGVDNCRIEIGGSNNCDRSVEVPIFDGSAREWVDAINQSGLKVAVDIGGQSCQKLAPYLNEPVHVLHNDSFIAAIPYPKVCITYGIDYPQAPAIGCQWFSSSMLDESIYSNSIGPSRTFCIYEETIPFHFLSFMYPLKNMCARSLTHRIGPVTRIVSFIFYTFPALSGFVSVEVEHMRNLGLIKGGSAETAIVCSLLLQHD